MIITPAALEIIFASCCAEVVQKAALHPLDSLKTRMQYDAKKRTGGSKLLFADLADGWRIIQSEPKPLRSLYRGLGPSVAGAVPTAMVYMPTYEASSALLAGTPFAPLAGVATGCVSACVRVPSVVTKSQLQLGLHKDTGTAVRAIMQQEGALGFFRGFKATVCLDVFYAVVQFAVLENLRRVAVLLLVANTAGSGPASYHGLSPLHNAVIGFMTGAITAAATEPVDVIRTRIMGQVKSGGGGGEDTASTGQKARGVAYGYRGVADGIATAVRQEGLMSLWKGLLPRLLLKSIGSSLWYAVYMASRAAFALAFTTAAM